MIKTTEVRRGNLIQYNAERIKGKVPPGLQGFFIVDEIRARSLSTTHITSGLPFGTFADDVEGVPLTPEILKALGFKMENGFLSIDLKHSRMKLCYYAGVYDKLSIMQMQGDTFDGAKPFYIHFGSNNTPFLHQLQNLFFTLSGEELDTQNLIK